MGDWKTRISTLWLVNAVTMVSLVLLELFRSGDLTHIMPPFQVDTWSLLLIAVAILADLAMAFLSQSLADKVNRWLNIVAGAVFGVAAFVALVEMLIGASVLTIFSAAGVLWMALIVWIAWKSK